MCSPPSNVRSVYPYAAQYQPSQVAYNMLLHCDSCTAQSGTVRPVLNRAEAEVAFEVTGNRCRKGVLRAACGLLVCHVVKSLSNVESHNE